MATQWAVTPTTWTSAESVNNPIQCIQQTESGTKKYVKCPSGFGWNEEDISNPDAGRTLDGTMHKEQLYVGGKAVQANSINLEWQNLSFADGAGILQVFNKEYLWITYWDAKIGDYVKKKFYVGNRAAPMYNQAMQLWSSISFNCITVN